jgi:hypothetical protein
MINQNDLTIAAEPKSLTLVRVKVEDPPKSFSLAGMIDNSDHPSGFIVSD